MMLYIRQYIESLIIHLILLGKSLELMYFMAGLFVLFKIIICQSKQ